MLALTASVAYGQVESGAPCTNTMPSNDACCYQDKKAAVMGGVDFVDLANNKKMGKDGAVGTFMCVLMLIRFYLTRPESHVPTNC